MSRYHVNPDTGNAGVCRATKSCPFGDLEEDHYGSKDEARAAFEQNNPAFNNAPAVPFPKHLTAGLVAKIPPVDGKTYQEHWDRIFSALKDPEVPEAPALARKLLGNPDFGRERGELEVVRYDSEAFDPYEDDGLYLATNKNYSRLPLVATIHTRNGGGNRECWCDKDNEDHSQYKCTAAIVEELEAREDFIRSWDGDFDSTYATFMFSLEETPELLDAINRGEEARHQKAARTYYGAIKDKTYSPLAILPVNEDTQVKLRETDRKLIRLRSDYRENVLKNDRWGPQAPTFSSDEETKAFKEVMDTPFHEWDYRKMQTYYSGTRANRAQQRDLVVKQEAAKTYLRKVELYDELLAEADKGNASKAALELLGGKDKIKQSRSLEMRSYERACEPVTSMKKKWKAALSYQNNEARLTAERDKLQQALHWPGQPGRMPDEFKV